MDFIYLVISALDFWASGLLFLNWVQQRARSALMAALACRGVDTPKFARNGVVAIRGARIAIRSHDQAQKIYD